MRCNEGIKRGWVKNNWRFIAGKIIELNGGFSSKPCLITKEYGFL